MYVTTVTKNVATNLDFNYNSSTTISGAGKLSVNQIIPTGTNGALINYNFSIVTGRLLAIAAVDGPLELRANSPTSPSNTFIVSAGESYVFDNLVVGIAKDSLNANLATFTGLFVYNSGSVAATLRMDSLFDPTPTI
jgi:hypothetical protein